MKITSLSLLALMLLVICGFSKNEVLAQGTKNYPKAATAVPDNYFPQKIGSRWEYKITLGKAEVQSAHEVEWQINGKILRTEIRSAYVPEPDKSTYSLVLIAARKATKQGSLGFKNGMEIKVEKDDLGLFCNANQLFYASSEGDGAYTMLIQTISPNAHEAPIEPVGIPLAKDGTSARLFFFKEKSGNRMVLNSIETLTYLGKEDKTMHFLRKVSASTDNKMGVARRVVLGRAFTEDYWFSQGIGLTKMVQKVGKDISMTVELVKYTTPD